MNDFTPVSSTVGGMLIGLAASLLLLTHGRIAGISGLYGGLLQAQTRDRTFRFSFVAGLVVTGTLVRFVAPTALETTWSAAWPTALLAGVLVGFGTRLGSGCTSGHGVCGLSRMSPRSAVATMAFMTTGFVTVFVVRHLVGGGR